MTVAVKARPAARSGSRFPAVWLPLVGAATAVALWWLVTVAFPNAGTVGYFCEPHGSPGSGMYGTIEVLAPAPPAPVDPAPSGNARLDALLAFAVVLVALLRLRRIL